MKYMRIRKAYGANGIPIEVWKSLAKVGVGQLPKLFTEKGQDAR